MAKDDRIQERRNDYDVTNTVRVSSAKAVRGAVKDLFVSVFPTGNFDPVWIAFHDFERLYSGKDPNYHAIDTTYHDIQHSLDMTLAMARLIAGHEKTVESVDALGEDRAVMALVTALFHDAGYLRHRSRDRQYSSGAELTQRHVTRGAEFLAEYLPTAGLEDWVPIAEQIVHFTGYEKNLDDIELDDPRDSKVGHLLGTADLLAQMADRCYLEKCRDRLFPEFVLGGVAIESRTDQPRDSVKYRSGKDLLSQTFDFYQNSARRRLDQDFSRAYRYMEAVFNGDNPYIVFIQKNLEFLSEIMQTGQWERLRRKPPCVAPDPTAESRLSQLALRRIKKLAEEQRIDLTDSRHFRSETS